MLNPNQLDGHEGKLLKILKEIDTFSNRNGGEYYERYQGIAPGAIVMLVALDYDQDTGSGWIDILHCGKVCRTHMNVRRWMEYFIPYPHGAFIQQMN